MPVYKATGVLTGTIEIENLAAAQNYLQQDDMTKYLQNDQPEMGIEFVQWSLDGDGHAWSVLVVCMSELTQPQSEQISSWICGQNSDGLGESFEQQEFAESYVDHCGDDLCSDCRRGDSCDDAYSGMISFDWETNKCPLERLA